MPGMPLIFPSSNPVEVVKFLSMWNGPGDCALLLKSKSKIGLYAVDSNKNDVLYPQWISVRLN